MEITPSPRLSGERAGVRGFELEKTGLLTPPLSSFWEEREKNGAGAKSRPLIRLLQIRLSFSIKEQCP
jgi:hypothetical protein